MDPVILIPDCCREQHPDLNVVMDLIDDGWEYPVCGCICHTSTD